MLVLLNQFGAGFLSVMNFLVKFTMQRVGTVSLPGPCLALDRGNILYFRQIG